MVVDKPHRRVRAGLWELHQPKEVRWPLDRFLGGFPPGSPPLLSGRENRVGRSSLLSRLQQLSELHLSQRPRAPCEVVAPPLPVWALLFCALLGGVRSF